MTRTRHLIKINRTEKFNVSFCDIFKTSYLQKPTKAKYFSKISFNYSQKFKKNHLLPITEEKIVPSVVMM